MLNCNNCNAELDSNEIKKYDESFDLGYYPAKHMGKVALIKGIAAHRCSVCKNTLCDKCLCQICFKLTNMNTDVEIWYVELCYSLAFLNARALVLGDFDDKQIPPSSPLDFDSVVLFFNLDEVNEAKLKIEEQYRKAQLPIPSIEILAFKY